MFLHALGVFLIFCKAFRFFNFSEKSKNPSFTCYTIPVHGKRQIARLGQLAFLCDTLKDTKKLVVF